MRKGFTLVELIIVIIIVGILASIGLTQYNKVIEKGRASEARMILGNLRSAEVAEYNENGGYALASALGVSAPGPAAGNCANTHFFFYACDAGTGTCTATRCLAAGKAPQGTIAFTKTLDINGTWGGTAGY